jgi:hypothetical protein
MQPEAINGSVLMRVGRGCGQATYANVLHLQLRLEGAWVTLRIEHLSAEHAGDDCYSARFPVQVLYGKACVGRAQIELLEAPLLTGSYLPEVQGLDTAFTLLFKTFLIYHRQELMHIAWDACAQSGRESQQLSHAADVRMAT